MVKEALKLEFDVLGSKAEPIMTEHGISDVEVVGKITRNRHLLYFEIQFVRDAIENVKKAEWSQLAQRIEVLEAKVTQLAEGIERTLVSLGDTDPRH